MALSCLFLYVTSIHFPEMNVLKIWNSSLWARKHLTRSRHVHYNSALSLQAKSCLGVSNTLLVVLVSPFSSSILHHLSKSCCFSLEALWFQTSAQPWIECTGHVMSGTVRMCTLYFHSSEFPIPLHYFNISGDMDGKCACSGRRLVFSFKVLRTCTVVSVHDM